MKIINNIFLIVLFTGLSVSPLIFWPWAAVPYEVPKVWFIERWIEILAGVGLIKILLNPQKRTLDKWLIGLIFAFVLVAIAASLSGVDLWKSIVGNYYRSDGLITLYHLAGLFLLVNFFWEEKWAKFTAWAISFGSLLTGISIVLLKTSGGSFGNPNFLAGYLAVTLPFTVYLIHASKRKIVRFVPLLLSLFSIIVILLTKSWGGIFSVVLFGTSLLMLDEFREKWIFIGLSVGILSILSFLYIKQNQGLGFVAEGRERIIRKIMLGVSKRPILGWGWANADYAFEAVSWPIALGHDVYVDKTHSMFLEVLATTGILGLAFYIGIIARTFFLLFEKTKSDPKALWPKILMLSLFLYIFHSQTNVISINEELIFWMIMGISGNFT